MFVGAAGTGAVVPRRGTSLSTTVGVVSGAFGVARAASTSTRLRVAPCVLVGWVSVPTVPRGTVNACGAGVGRTILGAILLRFSAFRSIPRVWATWTSAASK